MPEQYPHMQMRTLANVTSATQGFLLTCFFLEMQLQDVEWSTVTHSAPHICQLHTNN